MLFIDRFTRQRALTCTPCHVRFARRHPARAVAARLHQERAGSSAKRPSWARPSRVELWGDDVVTGARRHRRGDGRDAPHRPRDEPAQGRLGAVAHQPRRRARTRCRSSDEMFGAGRARDRRSRRCRDGAFDITYASVGHLYDYRLGVAPGRRRRWTRARPAIGWRHLRARPRRRARCASRREGMRIDLGGFAKGHAVDNAARSSRARGIGHAIVTRRRRQPRDRRPPRPALDDRRSATRAAPARWSPCCRWKTSRSRPRATTSATSSATACAATTSSTRAPAASPAGVHSVTILADDGLTAEALSKSRVRARRRARAWR